MRESGPMSVGKKEGLMQKVLKQQQANSEELAKIREKALNEKITQAMLSKEAQENTNKTLKETTEKVLEETKAMMSKDIESSGPKWG